MREPFKAAIFDIDGLLLDTEIFQYLAWQRACLDKAGYDMTPAEYEKSYVGRSSKIIAKEIVERRGLEMTPEKLLEARGRELSELVKTQPMNKMPFAEESISYFLRHRVPIAFATGAGREESMIKLSRSGLLPLFNRSGGMIVTKDDVTNGKPDPETYLKAMEMLGISNPYGVLSFEDTLAGHESATGAGTACFAVPNKWTVDQFPSSINTYHSLEDAIGEVRKNYFFQPSLD